MNAAPFRISAARVATLVLVALAPLAACKKDITLKDLSVPLEQDLILNVPDTVPTSGQWVEVLDPDANVDVRDNRNKLQDVSVQKLTYTVIDRTGDSTITGTGDWKFFPTDNPADATILKTVSNLNFYDLRVSGAEQELILTDAVKSKLVQLVKDKKKASFAFEGRVSGKPVWVRFKLKLYTNLKIGL